jgi:Ca2+-binding RTX toxin-like protein
MTRTNRIGQTFQTLEAREVPAFVMHFTAGNLKIVFDNNSTTGQAITISADHGWVTLNEHRTHIAASSVRSITVVGSDLANWFDLHFVSTQTGFHRLDGKVTVLGNGGDDVFMGTQFADKLIASGAGFSQFFDGGGNDTCIGGTGVNWFYNGDGKDTIVSNSSRDWIEASADDAVIRNWN